MSETNEDEGFDALLEAMLTKPRPDGVREPEGGDSTEEGAEALTSR
jgi:hypothetical protein